VIRRASSGTGQLDFGLPYGERIWLHVVRLSRAAVMALVDEQHRVLLLWPHRLVLDRRGWELPGGLGRRGRGTAEAAARELEEETGYLASRVEHLVTFRPMAPPDGRPVTTAAAPTRR
jgi:8-oxo-dGDP phosphatase